MESKLTELEQELAAKDAAVDSFDAVEYCTGLEADGMDPVVAVKETQDKERALKDEASAARLALEVELGKTNAAAIDEKVDRQTSIVKELRSIKRKYKKLGAEAVDFVKTILDMRNSFREMAIKTDALRSEHRSLAAELGKRSVPLDTDKDLPDLFLDTVAYFSADIWQRNRLNVLFDGGSPLKVTLDPDLIAKRDAEAQRVKDKQQAKLNRARSDGAIRRRHRDLERKFELVRRALTMGTKERDLRTAIGIDLVDLRKQTDLFFAENSEDIERLGLPELGEPLASVNG